MTPIFVDTAGWACLFHAKLEQHAQAVKIYREVQQNNVPLVTTNYVLTELVALLHSPLRLSRHQMLGILSGVRTSKWVKIIHISPELDLAAWELLENRTDKAWSLVDCSSFVVMNELGLTRALTTDTHFQQAGFEKLL